MALGRFVFEGDSQHISEKLSEFLKVAAEIADREHSDIVNLEEIGLYYGERCSPDVFITDAQWCVIDMSAISLCVEGNHPDIVDSIMNLASFIHKDISVFYSVTEFEDRVAITNDINSKYYDSRLVMLLSINPKLAQLDTSLYRSLQEMVGGAYRFNDENSMMLFVFDTFGFRVASRGQIAEIVELFSHQMLLGSGLSLSADEVLTNTEFMEYTIDDRNEAIVL